MTNAAIAYFERTTALLESLRKTQRPQIERAADLASGAARPIDDHRGSIEFRNHLVRVLTRRTLTTALERASP